MKPDYLQVLYIWLLFFAVIGMIAFPAFRLKRIAKNNGKKGWVFFLVGMSVGFGAILVNRLIAYLINEIGIANDLRSYLWIPYLIVGYGLVFSGITILTPWIKKPDEEIAHDVIDSDLYKNL
jgi:hypothetical protein